MRKKKAPVTEVHCDFENALIKAIYYVYKKSLPAATNLRVLGCYFHFIQALWRKAGKYGLKDKTLKHITRLLINWLKFYVFTPSNMKSEVYNIIKTEFEDVKEPKVLIFLEYF